MINYKFHFVSSLSSYLKKKEKDENPNSHNITAVINYTIKKKCMAHCTHRSELLNTFYEEAFLRVYKVF
ncbi:hypothetical protein CISIN_1g035310mg [Citrus sinensis]|uniref:Uncharacterized protein n=1 Tax=Citrus sinensis TaxID=2711 RepID=A0A067FDU2_CITSI|nr:hypothetical protein CISIN_1g035310mg [Citrus sinensis]